MPVNVKKVQPERGVTPVAMDLSTTPSKRRNLHIFLGSLVAIVVVLIIVMAVLISASNKSSSIRVDNTFDSDKSNCGIAGKVCEDFESCVLGACDSSTVQYTSDLADWTKMNEVALASNEDHSPDGVGWATYVPWDGIPRSFESFSSKKEFFEWICPGAIPRGIREVYYIDPVFTDPKNPTKAEVDHWHRRFVFVILIDRTIRQLRRLVGISEQEKPIKMDLCLSAIALWYSPFLISQGSGIQIHD
jgi:hypothetical protein